MLIVLLLFVVLSVRLIYINTEEGEEYERQILSQQRYDSVTIPYKRGDILDTKGSVLATSEKVYNVILDTKLLRDKEEKIEPTLDALEEYFGLDKDAIEDYNDAVRQAAKNALTAAKNKLEEGEKAEDYTVFYLDDEGNLTAVETFVQDGEIFFVTDHFSEYVVLKTVTTNPDVPNTGDNAHLGMMMGLLMFSAIGLALVLVYGKQYAYVGKWER